MITHSAITTIHNIISNKKPIAIMNLFNLNNQRKSKQISTKYLPRTEQFKKKSYLQYNKYIQWHTNQHKVKIKTNFKKINQKVVNHL